MAFHRLKRKQLLKTDIDTAWNFFSVPDNLNRMTPPNMSMQVLYKSGGNKVYAGQIITYIIKPILGIPLNWMTEIVHVKEKEYFVDEQRFGPYALWHHSHFFKEVEGGIEMTDIVNYKMPFGFIGEMAHILFVKKQLTEIFDYRNQQMERIFGDTK